MARETKVGLLIGVGLILLVGIIVSDHLAVTQANADGSGAIAGTGAAVTDFANAAQSGIHAGSGAADTRRDRGFAPRPPLAATGAPTDPTDPRATPAPAPAAAATPLPDAAPALPARFTPRPNLRPDAEALADPAAAPAIPGVPEQPPTANRLAATPIPYAGVSSAIANAAAPASIDPIDPSDTPAPFAALPQRADVEAGYEPPARPLEQVAGRNALADTPVVPAANLKAPILHRTRAGDTLAAVARIHFDDAELWTALADVNPDAAALADTATGVLPADTKLVIPDRAEVLAAHNRRLRDELEQMRRRAEQPRTIDRTAAGLAGDLPADLFAAVTSAATPAATPIVPLPAATDRRPAAAVASAALPAPTPAVETVEVRAGDSLSRLAARHLGAAGRYRDLFDANRDQLDSPDDIRAGMKLRLPGATSAAATSAAATPATATRTTTDATPATPATYTVKPGDSLARIARRVLGDPDRWQELFEANRDTLGSPDELQPGQQLTIPS